MAVPEDVRKVKRPKGTVVCDGKDGVYPVREKLSGTCYMDDDGKYHRPSRNGKVIGHIINMEFVEKAVDDSVAQGDVDLKDWGNVEMFNRLNRDLLTLLEVHYIEEDALRIYIMAILRAAYRGIPDRQLDRQYEETFLTEMFPPVNLKRTSISTFLRNVGKRCAKINSFMRMMVDRIKEGDHVIIDGSLRQDHSRVNSLSEISRKTRERGYKEILLMYAYSTETKQPLCSKVYPGNMVDQRAVPDFIEDFGIKKGIIVADKGFTRESVMDAVLSNKGLHYLLPLKRDADEIDKLDLYTYDSRLDGECGIQCKKTSHQKDGRSVWYYSFRDPVIASDQEMMYMSMNRGPDYDPEDLEKRRRSFGTLVFESDLELESAEVYEIYDSRWLIELFFRSQEDQMELDDTREHSDYSVIASNFIDYLASIMVSRMLVYLDDHRLLDKNTYGDLNKLMLRIKMTRLADGEWKVRRIAKVDAELLERMELLKQPIVPKEVKKRGRPVGSKDKKPRRKRGSNNNSPTPSG